MNRLFGQVCSCSSFYILLSYFYHYMSWQLREATVVRVVAPCLKSPGNQRASFTIPFHSIPFHTIPLPFQIKTTIICQLRQITPQPPFIEQLPLKSSRILPCTSSSSDEGTTILTTILHQASHGTRSCHHHHLESHDAIHRPTHLPLRAPPSHQSASTRPLLEPSCYQSSLGVT